MCRQGLCHRSQFIFCCFPIRSARCTELKVQIDEVVLRLLSSWPTLEEKGRKGGCEKMNAQKSSRRREKNVSEVALFCLLLFIFAKPSGVQAQDYPPYGPNVPTAHFDHGKRAQLTPPPVTLLTDGTGRVAQSSWNMELVGYDTLDGRSTYQPLVVHQGNRYIAYMAHHATVGVDRLNGLVEPSGTSILDVTDPTKPIYLFHIPGPSGSIDAAGSQMVHVCSGNVLPSSSKAEAQRKSGHWYMLRTHGNSSGLATPIESQEIYDVTNPAAPAFLTTVIGSLSNTHKNWWECDTGIAYLVANDPTQGWQHTGSTQHLKIYNLHDPANPEYIRDFGLVGQEPTANPSVPGYVLEGPNTPPSGIHGPISAGVEKNRVYMAYGVGASGVIQIVDREKLLKGCTLPSASANCATNHSARTNPAGWPYFIPGIWGGGRKASHHFSRLFRRRRQRMYGRQCTARSVVI
jgi:hypothetical protein